LIAGRWALFAAELMVVALRYERISADLSIAAAFGAFLLYNAVALGTLYRLPPHRVAVWVYLAADVLTVGTVTAITGGLSSPFAGLFYLVTLAGAVYYNLAGGLGVAAIAVALLVVSTALTPGLWEELLRGETRTQMIPYLLLSGGYAGHLVGLLKRLHAGRIELEARLRQREQEALLRLRDREIARGVQRAALPDAPSHPTLQVAVRFEPAQEVGGDFYCFFTEGPRLGILLGDVAGKGIAASLVSTSICHLARWLQPMENPEGFLGRLNRHLVDQLPDDQFATAVFIVLDPEAEQAEAYSAGHPPILCLTGDIPQRAPRSNLLLGLLPDVQYFAQRFSFRQGDTLVLYSDGFIEARSPVGTALGVEGLETLARRHAALPPEELSSRLVAETRQSGEVTDDLTLVVVRSTSGGQG
jgi:serine phosphatase RsbU (regulator of sigma subunit)